MWDQNKRDNMHPFASVEPDWSSHFAASLNVYWWIVQLENKDVTDMKSVFYKGCACLCLWLSQNEEQKRQVDFRRLLSETAYVIYVVKSNHFSPQESIVYQYLCVLMSVKQHIFIIYSCILKDKHFAVDILHIFSF